MEGINTDTVARIRVKAGLDEKKIRRAIEAIRTWLKQQPHLPQQIDDNQLERVFLRCKKSVERTKETLDMYYTLRTALPEIFSNTDPSGEWFRLASSVRAFVPLPQLTEDYNRVSIATLLDPDPDKYVINDVVKLLFMTLDLRLRDDYYISDIFILDMADMTRGFNSRLKAVHLINAPTFVDATVNMVKSLLKPKLASRVYVHRKGSESLQQHLPIKILPKELGGEAERLPDLWSAWVKKLEANRDWFLEQENLKSDESKRPGKTIDTGELFGFQGSFRRLSLD